MLRRLWVKGTCFLRETRVTVKRKHGVECFKYKHRKSRAHYRWKDLMSYPRSIEFSSKSNKMKVNICLLYLWMDVLASWQYYTEIPQCSLNSFRDRSPKSSIDRTSFFSVPFPWLVDNCLLLYHHEVFPQCVSVLKFMPIRTLVIPDRAHPYHPKLNVSLKVLSPNTVTFWSPR